MALNILTLNKFERTKQYHPNYIADVEFNGLSVKCDIYTNARLRFHDWLPENYGNSRLYAFDSNFAKMNGNLYLKIEASTPFNRVDEREIEKEFRKIIKGNGFKNLKKLE